jgi:hypothetical protein
MPVQAASSSITKESSIFSLTILHVEVPREEGLSKYLHPVFCALHLERRRPPWVPLTRPAPSTCQPACPPPFVAAGSPARTLGPVGIDERGGAHALLPLVAANRLAAAEPGKDALALCESTEGAAHVPSSPSWPPAGRPPRSPARTRWSDETFTSTYRWHRGNISKLVGAKRSKKCRTEETFLTLLLGIDILVNVPVRCYGLFLNIS